MDDVSIAKDCIDRMDEVFADDPESIDYDLVNNDEDREGEVAHDERVLLEPSEQEARRTLRPSNTSRRLSPAGLLDDREDSADEEVVDGEGETNQEGLQRCIGALKSFFLRRLEDCILSLGGSTEVLKGIKVQVSRISTGVTQGLLEVSYYFNRSKRFRTRVEVACSLGLMVSVKSVRGMTREQHYRIATETREKHLISQQLSLANYVCEEIQYSDNQIKLCLKSDAAVCTEAVMETTPLRTEASDRSSLYFAFGNVVVLNWGTICHYPCFHSQHQIYPIGFKCLRQELDITLDRVVDCVCEILAVYEGSDGQTSPASMASIQANEYPSRELLPLFRLSIAWQIPTVTSTGCMERTVVRVYEARTPQSAWQAAMLETVGLESLNMNMSYDAAIEDKYDAIEDQSEVMPPFETGDDEELEMRQKIRELRRKYFRMLRAEQSAGTQSAMKPRLNVDSSDGFFEDIVMRLIEGMDESIRCRNYAYCDTRDKGAGRKNMLKGYTKIYQKAKTLDKAIRRHAYVQEQLQLSSSCKRKKGADGSSDYSDPNNNNNSRTSNKRTKLDPKDRTKDMRFMVASALKSRTVRIKDIEKNINLMKFALAKYVKRRREDAKTLAEIVADREESHRSNRNKVSLQQPVGALMDSKAFGPNGGRPESIANFVVIDGAVMGQLIEIWEFLHAFSKKLQLSSDVPSIEQLMLAARTCDPRYRAVSSYTGSIHHTYDFVVAHQFVDPLPSDASELLDRIGVALTSQLMPDFERLLGLDSIGAQGSMLQKVPNNTLTWREIARTVLLTTCCKEVGVSEVDAVSLLRGRGFFTSPETADRKTLKLARRRIKLNYALRNEHQESVIGFSSGLCVHIPAPGMPYPEEGVLWSQLVGSLDQVPDSCGWLVFEIIKAAAFSACVIDTSASAKRLKRSLLSCLAHPSFRVNDGAAAKTAAMRILSEHGKSQASTRKPSSSLSSQTNSMDHGLVAAHAHTKDPHRAVLDQIKLVYDGSPYMIPLSTMDVWRKQLSEAVRHAAVQEVVSAPSTDMEVVRVEDGDVSSVVVVPSVAATTTTERSVQSMDSDAVQAEKLSVAMQRCYVVVRDLMTNPQSNAFLWPVDGLQFPEYYRSVPQPLSLSEVRTALVEGLYQDSIFRFYCDVTLVIENAMAFNVENSAVKTAAQKFLLLFERLFFETVLCWDHALPSHDSCHGCRSVVPIEGGSKIAVCDRCDACYHLGCLEPPMFSPPRSEWYCLPCVEQKGIASAHPYRTADVSHPEDPAAKGEVVGIEQIRQTLMFVVEFGGVRELWDGRKIRQFAMEPPAVTGMEGEDRDGADGLCASKSVFSMPTGYDYEDFDRVCGIARAYVGWGASHYLMPSVLMSEHNIAARTKSQDDSLFCQYRQSVATLGPSAGGVQGDELSMHEWGHLLTSLVRRILDATSLTAPLSEMDDKVDDDLVAQIQHGVQTDALPVERVFAMIRGESAVARRNDDNGDDDDDVDKDILLGSSSKKKSLRAAVDPSAGTMGASKRTTGASSSVADEELDDDVGSDDEDMQQESDQDEEFDVDMKTVQLADSEEEDELELFDDEGRCLTSSLPTREQQTSPAAFSERSSQEGCAFRPINIQPTSETSLADIIASPMSMKRRDVEKEWVQRLLSRQKGREDAHLTQLLVLDILTQLDVDGRKELEEEVFRYVGDEELGGDFYSAALGGIVKGCVNKSGDTISAADWYVAWEANLTALQQNANDSITCQICGYDENYVANPFVWGQTAEEWEADLVSNNAHAVITEPQLTGTDPSVFPLAQGVSVSVGIKGFKARYRVMKGLVWLPYNEQDALIERHENDAMHRTIRSGSLLMHECCANFMHFNRQLNTERSRRNEDLRMTEILSGLGRGKSTPIGMDRDGSFYWVFKDCRALYVSTGGVSTLKSNASSGCSPMSSFDSGCSPKWSVYRRESDIGRVVNWLVDAVPEERLLKRILQLLFPNCCCSEDPQPPRQEQLFSSSIIDSSQRSNKSNNTTRSLESTGSAVGNVLELLRPDVSMRPAVVHRSRLLDLHYPSPSNETKLSGAPFKYRKGDRILVDATPSNHILWDARVLETSIAKYDEDLRIRYYKVRFDQWGPAYDGWFEESQIVLAAGSVTGAAKQKVSTKTIQAESRQQYLQEHVWSAPPTLQSLNAYRFMGEPGRANSYRPPLSFSDSKGMVSQLRLALLIVEAALPHGSIDDSDDRWGEDFVTPWRAAVTVANDAVSLMQCQIMLEFGIRTAWLRPTGLKMLSCLASRTHAMRTATCGMVAIRIWTLDAAIKYDKLAATNSSQLSLASNPSDGKGSKPTPRAKHAKRK